MFMAYLIDKSIEDVMDNTEIGSADKALSNILYGLNHTQIRPAVPMSKDTPGFIFFTRPQLCLTDTNLRNYRKFYPYLTTEKNSIQRYNRVMLDPRLQRRKTLFGKIEDYYDNDIITSPLVDPYMPFIPILTNSVLSYGGFPDYAIPTYQSTPGFRREQIAIVDGTYETNEVFPLEVTFQNYINDPILAMMELWSIYSTLVFEDIMSPYLDMLLEDRVDYQTRIYLIILDQTLKIVKRIGCTGASFPVNDPMGKYFDYSYGKSYSDQTKEINIRFQCIGMNYNDDYIIKTFNEVNAIFNPGYRSFLKGNSSAMIKIPDELLPIVNHRGYPYIDPKTYRLHWLINKDSYTVKKINNLINIT